MVERNPPVWMQSGTYQAIDDRMVTGLLLDRTMNPDGSLKELAGGVVGPLDQVRITASGANMNFNISAGVIVIPASGGGPPGAYVCYNEGTYTGSIQIEGTGNPRIDVIVARIADQASGGAESAWHFAVVRGTPAASPANPTILPGDIPLATVRVLPSASNGGVNKINSAGQITDIRRFVASMGGVHKHWGNAPLPDHSPGRFYYDVTTSKMFMSNGTRWDVLYSSADVLTLLSAYRPRAATTTEQVNLVRVDRIWDPTPALTDTPGTSLTPLVLAGMSSPSGMFKVTLSAYGRLDAAGGRGSVAVEVLSASNVQIQEPTAFNGISFYSTGWEQTSMHYLTRLTPDTPYNFRMTWLRYETSTGTAYWSNCHMMVEPVI